jgi:hypothetical protein
MALGLLDFAEAVREKLTLEQQRRKSAKNLAILSIPQILAELLRCDLLRAAIPARQTL